jgi:paraquat-inducible protein B
MVDLVYDDNANNEELTYFNDLVVIPTGINTLDKFTDSVEEFLDKLNHLPVVEILAKLETLLDEGATTLVSIQDAVKSADELMASDTNTALVEQLTVTLAALEDMSNSFAADSQANQDLQRMLQSAAALLEELKPLMSQLKNQPSGLVFPSKQPAELEPQRKQP